MWVVAFDNVVIVFTAFVVSWVVSATQCTFRWRVHLLGAICTVVGPSAFDTRVGFITVSSSVPVLLASDALWNVFLVYPTWFD